MDRKFEIYCGTNLIATRTLRGTPRKPNYDEWKHIEEAAQTKMMKWLKINRPEADPDLYEWDWA